jgi:hypothetical protein
VTEEPLDGADVVAGLEQVGGEAVPEAVAGCGFGEARFADGGVRGSLGDCFVQIVAAEFAGDAVAIRASGVVRRAFGR